MSSMNYNNTNYKPNNQHRYDFFGRYVKLFSLKLRHMGGKKLEYGAKLLAIMTILSMVRIPIAEVEAVKVNPLWSGFYVLLIAWCVFWFLDRFVGHFLDGFLGGIQKYHFGMIHVLLEGTKKHGFMKTRLDILNDISFEIYQRKHPSFRKEVESIHRNYNYWAKGWLDFDMKKVHDGALSELYARDGVYLKNGWKVCSSKKR